MKSNILLIMASVASKCNFMFLSLSIPINILYLRIQENIVHFDTNTESLIYLSHQTMS